MLNKTNIILVSIYGLTILVLGYVGYQQSGSMASLIAGLVFGGLLVLSALAMMAGKNIGAYVALLATVALTGVFSYRYAMTGKELPAILAVLSGAMLLCFLVRFARWNSN
jgi:uncharacterized membrane protein (UPF0136 family)